MAVNCFFKIDGIKGNSTVQKHEGEIEVETYRWGLSHPAGAGERERAATRPSFQDFSFTMDVGSASPLLFIACADGKIIAKAELTAATVDGPNVETFLTISFTDIVISGFKDAVADGGGTPAQEVSLNFGKVEVAYVQKTAGITAGPIKRGWDVKANQAM